MGPRDILVRGMIAGLLAATVAAGGFLAYVAWYTGGERIIPGVRVGGVAAGGLTPEQVRALAAGRASSTPAPCPDCGLLTLHGGGQVLREAEWDVDGAVEGARRLGREGSLWDRAWTFAGTWVRGGYVPLQVQVHEEPLQVQVREETPPAEVRENPPDSRVAQGAGQHLLARFTTDILNADKGRVQNITMAVERISGRLVRPGEVFSFNELVGPRDAENGWAPAKEIYNGEFVLGYGGGICQVTSTLYNAVLLAGLPVVERSHHTRPLAYIHPGRDATVAWDSVDFKFRNGLGQPVLIGARVLPPAADGGAGRIEVSLHSARPRAVEVRIESADERFHPPENVEVADPSLPAGKRVVVDEGYYGIDLKIYRVISDPEGVTVRELVSHDVYEPKPGRVLVGTGTAVAPGGGS